MKPSNFKVDCSPGQKKSYLKGRLESWKTLLSQCQSLCVSMSGHSCDQHGLTHLPAVPFDEAPRVIHLSREPYWQYKYKGEYWRLPKHDTPCTVVLIVESTSHGESTILYTMDRDDPPVHYFVKACTGQPAYNVPMPHGYSPVLSVSRLLSDSPPSFGPGSGASYSGWVTSTPNNTPSSTGPPTWRHFLNAPFYSRGPSDLRKSSYLCFVYLLVCVR